MSEIVPFPIWKRLLPLYEIPEHITHWICWDWLTREVPCTKLMELRTEKVRGFRNHEVRHYLEFTHDRRDRDAAAIYGNPGAC